MKKLFTILGISLAFFVPSIAAASIAAPWNATSTDPGFISPNLINGSSPWLIVNGTGTSTFAGPVRSTCFTTNGTSCITATGGSGVGTIATSSLETSGQIPFYTSTNGYPALLSGGVSGFNFNNATNLFTVPAASSTGQISAGGQIFGTASGVSSVTAPSFSFTGNPTYGILLSGTALEFITNGIDRADVTSSSLRMTISGGPQFSNANGASIITPSIVPDRADTTTGFAAGVLGNINAIVGGNEITRWTSTGTGFGTSSPSANVSIAGSSGGTQNVFIISTSTSGFATSTALIVNSNGNESHLNGSSITITALGVPAGTFLAADPTGKIIATTTPSGGGSSFAYPFPNNATSTLLTFNGGLIATASSTFTSGLNVSGAAGPSNNYGIYTDGTAPIGFSGNGILIGGQASNNSATGVGFLVQQSNASGLSLESLGGINYLQNNTGIGTSTPAARLHIAGPGNTSVQQIIEDTSAGKNMHQQGLQTVGGALAFNSLSDSEATTTEATISTSTTPTLSLGTNGVIAIGSTTPWGAVSVVSNQSPIVAIATSTTALPTFEIDNTGHTIYSGNKPTCDANCTFIAGNDSRFRVRTGTTISSTVVTFANAFFTLAPICKAGEGDAGSIGVSASSTLTNVTLTAASALTSKDIEVSCDGIQ